LAWIDWKLEELNMHQLCSLDVNIIFDSLYLFLLQSWYIVSKTLAEEAAWRFAKENEIDLVTINPRFVIGPLLQPTLNFTTEEILKLIDGTLYS
jgi:nucleoside-diphosphate-sugar epimerase